MDKIIIENAYLVYHGFNIGYEAYFIEFDLLTDKDDSFWDELLSKFSKGNKLILTIEVA